MKVEKRKPLPVDPEAVAFEENRRAELSRNDAYKRLVAQAQATERFNAEGALQTALADLKRCSLKRDTTQPARDAYNRCHLRVTRAAERVCSIIDGSIINGKVQSGEVQIPAWLPPPTPTKADTIIVRAPRIDGTYRERLGLNRDGSGLPLRGPGSNVDPEWLPK